MHYVGYYYNSRLGDCVFILPKVLLSGGTDEKVFGKYRPENIVDLLSDSLEPVHRDFIYKFAVWIYRAIVVFKNDRRNDTSIIYHSRIAQIGRGTRRLSNTYLDIILQLMQFARDHQSYFFTIIRNQHSGFNKINWTRTISRKMALIHDNRPFYPNPVNKKRQINFDEELLVIFFSIINYIGDSYGFSKEICCQFQLIKGQKFQTYLHGYGITRLRQIKYKYFSDKALEMWHLCYAFLDESRQVFICTEKREYLLAKNFNIVFESIIDELIGDNPPPDGIKKQQQDGKVVDHIFTAKSLIDSDISQTYYIGDSKYYKKGHNLGSESIYKQYTYARNVIQWNLDIFNNDDIPNKPRVKLRDDLTEGYAIIPNFFVSAMVFDTLDYADDGLQRTDRTRNHHRSEQFRNRLFDRDTLLLFHYDVNFLFVLSMYARNNQSQKMAWKQKIRARFRTEIQDWLQQDFDFYAMKPNPGVDSTAYIKAHFQDVLGKVYTPFGDNEIFSLALDNAPQNQSANAMLLSQLSKSFQIVECKLGENPSSKFPDIPSTTIAAQISERQGVLMVMMENYQTRCKKFLSDGQIAIAVKNTSERMSILGNISNIGLIVFHVRKNSDYHAFALDGAPQIVAKSELSDNTYCNISTTEIYILIRFRTPELNIPNLRPSRLTYDKTTRYDAQYAEFGEI